MFNIFKRFFSRRIVGIDIGTASIKIVEVSSWGRFKQLKNYAEIKSSLVSKKPLLDAGVDNSVVSDGYTSKAIREVLDEAGIKTKSAIFSVSDFYTFSTSFDIPQMPKEEIGEAIRYNAAQYITLPISEVTLDWRIVSNYSGVGNTLMKIFIVAIPNKIIDDYKAVAKNAGLELVALEAEVFGTVKALIKDSRKIVCLIDIGAQSSTINIVEHGFLKRSYSANFNSNQLTNAIASNLNINFKEAEEIRNKDGLNHKKQDMVKVLGNLIDSFLKEIQNVSSDFLQSEKKQVEEFYLLGGIANMPGLREYFFKVIGKQIYVQNCFLEFSYPSVLEESLKEMSPRFSIALGVALGVLDSN